MRAWLLRNQATQKSVFSLVGTRCFNGPFPFSANISHIKHKLMKKNKKKNPLLTDLDCSSVSLRFQSYFDSGQILGIVSVQDNMPVFNKNVVWSL